VAIHIEPIRCLRPRPDKAQAFATPPYDVFTSQEARNYVQEHPQSFLAIDRPETTFPPDATPGQESLGEKALQLLHERRQDFTLLSDQTPCFYIYELDDHGHTQTGVVGAIAVEDYLSGALMPHEQTRPVQEAERKAQIEATGAQMSPALIAYPDQLALGIILGSAKQAQPLYDFSDADGVEHKVWRIARSAATDAIAAAFTCVDCAYIADGHHRFAAAVSHAQDEERAHDSMGAAGSVLAVLFPESQLSIRAYHRVLLDSSISTEEFLAQMSEAGFEMSGPLSAPYLPSAHHSFGCSVGGVWYAAHWPHTGADIVSDLDVSVLQDHVLAPLFGVVDPRRDPRMRFVGADDIDALVATAEGGLAFTLCATTMSEIAAVAHEGKFMPPKSTWFWPKLMSGLFVRKLT
jgi:uncharacterized protein (DUF1015 family)